MENKNFRKLIGLLESKPQYLQHLARVENEYAIKIYKISELTIPTIIELYSVMEKKYSCSDQGFT